MPKIQMKGIADAKDPQPPSDGIHDLRIMKATHKQSRNSDSTFTEIVIDVVGEENTAPVFFRLNDPAPSLEDFVARREAQGRGDDVADEDDAKAAYQRHYDFLVLQAKKFMVAFDIPFDEDGFDTESLEGREARLRVYTTEEQGPDGQTRKQTQIDLPDVAA